MIRAMKRTLITGPPAFLLALLLAFFLASPLVLAQDPAPRPAELQKQRSAKDENLARELSEMLPRADELSVKLAVATARQILEDYQATDDAQERAKLLTQARNELLDVMLDPELTDLGPFQLGAIVAVESEDESLAAFCYEAMDRLQPSWFDNNSLMQVMIQLRRLDAEHHVDIFRVAHEERERLWKRGPVTDPEQILRFAKRMHSGDRGVPAYPEFAVALLEFAANEYNDANAQYLLARTLPYSGRATVLLESAAKQGHREAQYAYGQFSYRLRYNLAVSAGVDPSVAADDALTVASPWYLRAAKQGHPEAQYEIANFYRDGNGGLTRDIFTALDWYERAADHGHEEAKEEHLKLLGKLLEQSQGALGGHSSRGTLDTGDKK